MYRIKLDEDKEENYSRKKNCNCQVPEVGRYFTWLKNGRELADEEKQAELYHEDSWVPF